MRKMFKNMSREEHFSGGQTSASSHAAHGVAPLSHENQESSWIGMFSVVSRPALSFLQKYLPGRPRTPALSDSVTGWVSGDFKHNFVDGEKAFLGQLDDIMPATQRPTHHLSYLHCQHDSAACLVGSNGESTMSWLTADSLRELGIQHAAEMDMNIRQQNHLGYLATARSFLSQVLLSSASAQEIKHAEGGHVLGGKDWSTDAASFPTKSAGSSRTWWGGFWGSEESSQSWLSNISWSKEATGTSKHCPQLERGTKAAVAKPTELFVLRSDGQSMPGESAGPSNDKEEPIDNGSLQINRPESLQNSEGLTLENRSCIIIDSHLVGAGAVTACSEVAVLTPDQDNGYSSLEEEHSICRLYMVKAPCEEQPQGVNETKGDNTSTEREAEGEISGGGEEGESMTIGGMEEEEKEEETEDSDISDSEEAETPTQEGQSAAAMPLTVLRCQNKAIAYIMGSPCSDDDSQSDDECSDDDDGFDSEGSSEFSDSDDDEDSDSDDQADSETERLWNSLCQSRDPYSPCNFTASIHTNTTVTSTMPRTIPASITASAASSCSPHASPASPPNQVPSPLSSSPASPPSPSPLRDSDAWEDSTSASEADEAENLRLWNSLSSSSDPYSPLNFQAPLRTQEPPKAGPSAGGRGKKSSWTPHRSPRHATAAAASPPRYRKEEAEERLDSGFSETLPSAVVTSTTTTTTVGYVLVKKVSMVSLLSVSFAPPPHLTHTILSIILSLTCLSLSDQ